MYRSKYVGWLPLFALLLILSCEDNPPTAPLPFDVYVQIDSFTAIIAQEDALHAVAFELLLTNDVGDPVSGAGFNVWVESGPGETAFQQSESDPDGIVRALYYLTVPFGDTTAIIKATAGSDTASTSINITGLPAPFSLDLTGPDAFYPNYGESASDLIRAIVLDRRSNPVVGQELLFSLISGQATINGETRTDTFGVVENQVTVDGYWSGDLIIAASVVAERSETLRERILSQIKIEADRNLVDRFLHGFAPSIDSESLIDRITIPVRVMRNAAASATVEITGGNPNYWVSSDYTVIAELRDANDEPVAGVDVTLVHSLGDTVVPVVTNLNGIALFSYTPIRFGDEELAVSVDGNDIAQEGTTFPVFSDSSITFITESELDTTNHQTREHIFRGRMTDGEGRGIPGELIGLSVSLGWLDPGYVLTDPNGYYRTEFHTRENSGIVTLVFQWRDLTAQTRISLHPHPPHRIEFPPLINYQMPNDTLFSGRILDCKGRRIEVPTQVALELLNSGSFSNGTSSDTVLSSRGSFNVRIGGDGNGCISRLSDDTILKMTVLDAEGNESNVTAYSHFIVEGNPAHIELRMNPLGDDVGGGTWQVIVQALVTDRHGDPVPDGILVYFNGLDFDSSYTGNSGTPGVASIPLIYNSNNTFDSLAVEAFVRNADGDLLDAYLDCVLPLQEGTLELHVDPANYMFEHEEDDTADVRVWAILTDGHQILINNAPIVFSVNRGRFWYDNRAGDNVEFRMYEPGPVRRHTGPLNDGRTEEERQNDDDERGHAVVWWRANYLDVWDPFWEVTIQVQAQVEGYEDVAADPAFIFYTIRP